jgi:predicted MFS family arabinose efflux permease
MSLLLISCVVSLSGRSYQQLLPAFSHDVLNVGPDGLGLMMSAPGLGTVVGTATLASMADVRHKGRAFFAGMLFLSIALMLFALNRSFPVALVLLFFAGIASLMFSTMMTTMLQLDVAPEMRGRIMALVSVSFQGVQPLGSLFTGAAASAIGISEATFIAALLVGVVAVVAWILMPSVRDYARDPAAPRPAWGPPPTPAVAGDASS